MQVAISELGPRADDVFEAVERGERVALTAEGRAIADIVPRAERVEGRPTELVLADLAEISALAARLGFPAPD